MNDQSLQKIEKSFHRGVKWNIAGSIIYEIFKTGHCLFLWKLIDPIMYGKVGSLFSIMYLAIRLADFGLTYSLPPFVKSFTKSKKSFVNFFIYHSFLPHTIPVIIVAVAVTYWYEAHFNPPYTYLLPLLIIIETARSFLRMFLHTVFKSKITVIIELIVFFSYISYIWGAHLVIGMPLTINLVFIPHLVDSIVSLICFFIIIKKYYKKLPDKEFQNLSSKDMKKRIFRTRAFNYLLRLNRNMFTSNLLTPLFAIVYDLEAAGIFYFASSIANAIHAIIRSVVNFAGGGLFAHLKDAEIYDKKNAFKVLSCKVMYIIMSIGIFFLINYRNIIRYGNSSSSIALALSYSILYLMITVTEFFFLLYEQFYIIEEATQRLFLFKLFELILFYGIIYLKISNLTTLTTTLITIIIVRVVNIFIIGTDAYLRWNLFPAANFRHPYLAIVAFLSLITSATINFFTSIK